MTIPKPHCQICGSTKTLGGGLCQYMCFWVLEGWLGWNARSKKVAVRSCKAVRWAGAIISYPKLITAARLAGWMGRENTVTFPMAAKAAAVGK